jgi:uncharacterized protein (DUF1330 family)
MSAYVLSVIDKKDEATYARYGEAGFKALEGIPFEIELAEPPEVLEGHFPGTTLVLMKFESMAVARQWWNSDAYRQAVPFRHAAAETPFVVLFPGDGEKG